MSSQLIASASNDEGSARRAHAELDAGGAPRTGSFGHADVGAELLHVHSAVGWFVTFQCTVRRVPTSRTRNTNAIRSAIVTDAKKSHARTSGPWLHTNVLQDCPREPDRDGDGRGM